MSITNQNIRCEVCHSEAIGSREVGPYDAAAFVGLPNVIVLNAAVEYVCRDCNHVLGVSIPEVHGLKVAAAVARVMIPRQLEGKEIRTLRKLIGVSGKEMAEALEVTPETVSRWENGHMPMGIQNERVFRTVAGLKLASGAPLVRFDPGHVLSLKIHAEGVGLEALRFARVQRAQEQPDAWANASPIAA